jgi:hypothetical protein
LEALSTCCTEQSGATPDTVRCASDYAALTLRALFLCQRLLQSTIARVSRCFAGTPDSPVNYSGVRLLKPGSGWFTLVRAWGTGHCPVRQTRAHLVSFALSNRIPNLNIYWFVLNLFAPLEHVFYSKLASPYICVGHSTTKINCGKRLTLFPFQSPPFW